MVLYTEAGLIVKALPVHEAGPGGVGVRNLHGIIRSRVQKCGESSNEP